MQNIEKKEMLYEGKAKILYSSNNPEILIQYFKDDVTAFNKVKFEIIQGKGVINNQISSLIMEKVKDIVPTHFISKLNDREQLVKPVKIIPLEVIVRNIAAGSFSKNFGITSGTKLKSPSFELFFKKDELGDPMISPKQVIVLGIATQQEIDKLEELSLTINSFLQEFFAKAGITLVDFKVEFGFDSEGNITLADEISPDTCRLWDAKTGEVLDKDVFRKNLGDLLVAYKKVLSMIS